VSRSLSTVPALDEPSDSAGLPRVGYVLKVFPRFSETFILSELLAHQRAGLELEVFSLYPPVEGRFHESLARLTAPVSYIERRGIRAEQVWEELSAASAELPCFLEGVRAARGGDVRDVYQSIAVARAALERGVEHLHAHFASAATTVARLAARFAGLSYSFTAHAKDIFHVDASREDLADKLSDAGAVVTVSDYNRSVLEEISPGTPVSRIYNGVELERYRYSDPSRRPPVIAAVGRLVEKKGFRYLIDACARLTTRGVRFECRIAGTGELEEELRGHVCRLGLEERVKFLGPRSQDQVQQLVSDAAALAAPCVVATDGNRDGLPTVLVEAMALGTPCVATDVTGIPEIVHHGRTGLLAPQRDPVALADRLERLLAESALRRDLALAARRQIDASFDVDRNTVILRRFFTEAARGHRPAETSSDAHRLRLR